MGRARQYSIVAFFTLIVAAIFFFFPHQHAGEIEPVLAPTTKAPARPHRQSGEASIPRRGNVSRSRQEDGASTQQIRVRVVDATTNRPVSNFEYLVIPSTALPEDWENSSEWTKAEATASDVLLPAADVQAPCFVGARAPGYAPACVRVRSSAAVLGFSGITVRLRPDSTPPAVETAIKNLLAAPDRGALEGRVTIRGMIPSDIRVEVFGDLENSEATFEGRVSSATGDYLINDIRPGRKEAVFYASAEKEEHRIRTEVVDIESNKTKRLDLDFGDAGAIYGTISAMRENEVATIIVIAGEIPFEEFSEDDFYRIDEQADKKLWTQENGEYRIDGLEDGVHTVFGLIYRSMGSLQPKEENTIYFQHNIVHVEPGRETRLDFAFD